MIGHPFISVIIVNWNVKELLRRCIFSINEHLRRWEYEIIVVDNASSDGSIKMLKKEFPEITIFENKSNRGFAAANNQAAKIAKGIFLLFVNPDTELQNDIQPMISHFSDERVAVVFGKFVDKNGNTQGHAIKRFPTFLNQTMEAFGLVKIFPNIAIFNEEERNLASYEKPHFIDWGTGAFFIIRKDAFEKVGRFDEDYFVYGEEKDLLFQIKRLGYRTMFEPSVHIFHHLGSSTKQNPKMYLMLQQNTALFVRKNYSRNFTFIYRYFHLVIHHLVRSIHDALFAIFSRNKIKREILLDKMKNRFDVIKWALFLNKYDGA